MVLMGIALQPLHRPEKFRIGCCLLVLEMPIFREHRSWSRIPGGQRNVRSELDGHADAIDGHLANTASRFSTCD